ncbi:hypothetical protein AeMF1_016079 [Aphanomyces euteiches]|nr:hypothetical protein AeMF1_016079 [Aphanomyces euteiches]KAH9196459.1 hypothetical protein AeNC1_001540 [Aphanomyces euteiches]
MHAIPSTGTIASSSSSMSPPTLQVPLAIRQGVRQQIAALLRQRCQASPEHLTKVAARIDQKLVQAAPSIAAYQDRQTLSSRVHESVRDLFGSVQKRQRAGETSPRQVPSPTTMNDILIPTNLSRSYARRTKDAPMPVTSMNGVIPMSQLCIPVASEKDRLTLSLALDTLGNMLSGQCPFPPGFTMVETLTITPPKDGQGGSTLSPTAICLAFAKCLETGACKNLKSLTLSGLFRDHFSAEGDHPLGGIFQALSKGACPHLRELHCASNSLQDYGATAMSLWLANSSPKMQVLNLEENNIGDAGVMSLAWAFSHANSGLSTLRLGSNALGDRSAGALAAVFKSRGFESLEVLDLRRNAIKAAGAKCLLQVIRTASSSGTPFKLREINIDAAALQPPTKSA